jgi:hypothetical protein
VFSSESSFLSEGHGGVSGSVQSSAALPQDVDYYPEKSGAKMAEQRHFFSVNS